MNGAASDRRAWAGLAAAALLVQGGLAIRRLGFYHDDWAILSYLQFDREMFTSLRAALKANPDLLIRPLDTVLWAGFHRLFGLDPLPWHLYLMAASLALALLTYAVARRHGAARETSALAALVLLAYPSKDATLYWPVVVTIASALVAFAAAHAANTRWLETGKPRALLAAALAWCVCLALYEQCLLMPLAWLAAEAAGERGFGPRARRAAAVLGGIAAAYCAYRFAALPLLGLVQHRPVSVSARHVPLTYLAAVNASLGPKQAWYVLRSAAAGLAASPLLSACALALPWLLPRGDRADAPRSAARALAVSGAAMFVLAYLPIAFSAYTPTPFHQENRLNLAGVYGLVLLGAGLLSGAPASWRPGTAARLLAGLLLCAQVRTAGHWAESTRRQTAVIEAVAARADAWPLGTVLLVRVPERYIDAKVPVFDSHYDISGALALRLGDRRRAAKTVSPRMSFEPGGVRESGELLPYASVRWFDAERGSIEALDYAAARRLAPTAN